MRLALEDALHRADTDTLVRFTPLLTKVKGDGVLTTAAWRGPRDAA